MMQRNVAAAYLECGGSECCREQDHGEKFVVGQRLRFLRNAPGEIPVGFAPGDVLVVLPENGCGMGIDVRRESDGKLDMVWPEEVEVVR